jgi:anaerobic dimethyl sulfoxide reductase subunit A
MASDFLNSKTIIMWGYNPAVTIQGTNTAWYIAQARENGARVISVDPKYTDSTAILADMWIPIRPGSDTAVMLAMANVIIKEGLQDQDFIDRCTVGYDVFKDYVLGKEDGLDKTPEWAAEIGGTTPETIINLAHEYAINKPAALLPGSAAGRSAFGEQYHRAACTLAAITGNIGIPGGHPAGLVGGPGAQVGDPAVIKTIRRAARMPSPENSVEAGVPPRKTTLGHRSTSVSSSARVNTSSFADAILKGKAGGYHADYKFLWLSNNNYLNQLAEVNKTVKAFNSLEFILVTEQFMTATARYADIILPVCTYMERNDFYQSISGSFYGLVNKCIEPIRESKSQLEICTALAKKLGIEDYNEKTDEEWTRTIIGNMSKEGSFPDYETLKEQGVNKQKPDKPIVAFQAERKDPENHPFPTPSGKIEIYSQSLADMDHPQIPPIPKYIEPWESPSDPLAEKYPLQLVTTHFRRRAHSQFDNIPWLNEHLPQMIQINSADAEARGIKRGDLVRIFNDRGQMVIPADVSERIMPGVVDVPQGAWYKPDENGIDRGGCANVLTKNVTSPCGAFTGSTSLVQVEKYRS